LEKEEEVEEDGGDYFVYLTRGACTNNGTNNPRFWSTRIMDMGLFCN
jgi:hypothetical protein